MDHRDGFWTGSVLDLQFLAPQPDQLQIWKSSPKVILWKTSFFPTPLCIFSYTWVIVFTLLPVSLDSFCLKIAMKKFNPNFHLKSIFDSYRLFIHFQEGTMCKHEVLADYSYLSDSITGLLSSYTWVAPLFFFSWLHWRSLVVIKL